MLESDRYVSVPTLATRCTSANMRVHTAMLTMKRDHANIFDIYFTQVIYGISQAAAAIMNIGIRQ